MPDLNFTVERAEPEPHAAAPLLVFKLRIAETPTQDEATTIPAIALRCQIRIEPTRRRYAARRTGTATRPLRRARPLGPDLAEARSGLTPASSSRRSPATRSSTYRFPARSTSMSPRPNIFMRSKMARFRSACCSAAPIFYTDDDGLSASQPDPLGERGHLSTAGVGLERDDGAVLSQLCVALPGPRCLRSTLPLQEGPGNPHLGAGDRDICSIPSWRRSSHEPGTRGSDRQRRPL